MRATAISATEEAAAPEPASATRAKRNEPFRWDRTTRNEAVR